MTLALKVDFSHNFKAKILALCSVDCIGCLQNSPSISVEQIQHVLRFTFLNEMKLCKCAPNVKQKGLMTVLCHLSSAFPLWVGLGLDLHCTTVLALLTSPSIALLMFVVEQSASYKDCHAASATAQVSTLLCRLGSDSTHETWRGAGLSLSSTTTKTDDVGNSRQTPTDHCWHAPWHVVVASVGPTHTRP